MAEFGNVCACYLLFSISFSCVFYSFENDFS